MVDPEEIFGVECIYIAILTSKMFVVDTFVSRTLKSVFGGVVS